MMKIKSLNIHAFGRFKNKTIEFNDGVNIIYGMNEEGKTTIHKFIEAMFYGFFKAYTKTRQYEGAYEAYLPWDHSGYSGTLTFEDEGRVFRLERQFTKGKDALKVFDAVTGEVLTETYDYNKVIRQVEPGIRHFGHNRITYRNTVSLAQMASPTDGAMVTEIKDNMSNLASTNQNNISVDKVLGRIEKESNAIGSPRKKTSPYHQVNQEIEHLKLELKEAKKVHFEIQEETLKAQALKESLLVLEAEIEKLKTDLSYIEGLKKTKVIATVEALLAEDQTYLEVMASNETYALFTLEKAEALRKHSEQIKELRSDQATAKENIQVLTERMARLEDVLVIETDDMEGSGAYEAVNQGVYTYEDLSDTLKSKKLEQSAIVRNLDQVSMAKEGPKVSGLMYGFGVMTLVFLIAAVLYQPMLALGAAMTLVLLLVFGLRHKANCDAAKLKEELYMNLKQSLSRLDEEIQSIEARAAALLQHHNVGTIVELKTLRDDLLAKKSLLGAKALEREQAKQAMVTDQELLAGKKMNYHELSNLLDAQKEGLQEALGQWRMRSEEDIAIGLQKHMDFLQAKDNHIQVTKRIDSELKGETLEGLSAGATSEVREVTLADEKPCIARLEALQGEQLKLTEAISVSLAKQATLGKTTRRVVEIEESISAALEKLNAYDQQLAVTDLMKATIESIAVDIQNNFAPVLNGYMSKVVQAVTDGRYSNIKVNPAMDLTIYDEQNHRTIRAESLSAGTIDILYLGLRLGISEVLTKGKALPLIMDDPFVQYDHLRLGQAMTLLDQLNRQVLLFTCHQREARFLNENNLAYKEILL